MSKVGSNVNTSQTVVGVTLTSTIESTAKVLQSFMQNDPKKRDNK